MATAVPGLLADIAGNAIGTSVGFGLGFALGTALEAEALGLQQDSFATNPLKAIDPGTAARIVAQGLQAIGWGEGEAKSSGIDAVRFANLVAAELRAPAMGTLIELIRRQTADDPDVEQALRKAQLDPRWDDAIKQLALVALEPAELAKAIHRGIMKADGLLIAVPPKTPGKVDQVPESPLDPIEQASWAGMSAEQLRVLVGNAGLPPGIVQMLELLNRDEITEDDFRRGVGESNLRNEWATAMLALRRRLLTPHEYQEAALRGVITNAEADAGAALVGMTTEDAGLLFEILGRPVSVRAITTGLARGGTLGGTYADVPEPYQDAIRRSNIRPEYAGLAYANRYSYPGAFVLRSLAQAGELTEAETLDVLLKIGWEPALAEKVAKRWAGGGGGAGKQETKAELDDEYQGGFITETEYRAALEALGFTGAAQELEVELGDARRAKRYREKAIDAINAAYLAFRLDDGAAGAELAAVNVTGNAATMLLALWQLQRRDTIRLLTPAQVKKAFTGGLIDRATALAELEDREYTATDAATLLDE